MFISKTNLLFQVQQISGFSYFDLQPQQLSHHIVNKLRLQYQYPTKTPVVSRFVFSAPTSSDGTIMNHPSILMVYWARRLAQTPASVSSQFAGTHFFIGSCFALLGGSQSQRFFNLTNTSYGSWLQQKPVEPHGVLYIPGGYHQKYIIQSNLNIWVWL